MEQQLVEIREQQKASWDKFSPGWKKWDEPMMDFLQPIGEEIIRQLDLGKATLVLDIASGTGEPGLTIASQMKVGKVILTDLSKDMLAITLENAVKRGIRNIETQVCDVCELPFPAQSFDAISCRFGFMFFPDMKLAAQEMYRVLKPGGKVATSVWNEPGKNFWITAIADTINRNMELPTPPPGAPGMFRCAATGIMRGLFQQAGFKNISEKEVFTRLKCGDAQTYWTMMTEVAAPFVAALSKADEAMRTKIRNEVIQRVNQQYPDGKATIDASAWVISAEK